MPTPTQQEEARGGDSSSGDSCLDGEHPTRPGTTTTTTAAAAVQGPPPPPVDWTSTSSTSSDETTPLLLHSSSASHHPLPRPAFAPQVRTISPQSRTASSTSSSTTTTNSGDSKRTTTMLPSATAATTAVDAEHDGRRVVVLMGGGDNSSSPPAAPAGAAASTTTSSAGKQDGDHDHLRSSGDGDDDDDDDEQPPSNDWKAYAHYHVKVDPNQDDKALEIKLCQFKRPHMRAFHCAWFSFFNAFFVWFAIAPLQSEIRTSLKLSTQDLWTASIVGVGGTIVMRFVLGPLCDKYGSRVLMSAVLCAAAVPCALTGLVNSATGLIILRLFIGVAGGAFVMCQYWTSRFFAKSVVGTANAMVAGWGNLGAGVTQLMVGSALFPLFKYFFSYLPPEQASTMAWRTVCVVPALLAVATGITILFVSDDCPYGQYKDLKKHGTMPEVSAATSFRAGAQNLNTWILFAHYGCSFGVELTMYNASALYFVDKYKLSTSSAAAVASLYGWMLLFTRATGGYISDRANARFGMRGRLAVHTIALLGEGTAILVFAHMQTLATTIVAMVFFSIFCQGASGAIFAIVPYVDPPATGSIAGIVGAGGSVGGVIFGLVFRQMAPDATSSFIVMGIVVLVAPILSLLIRIKGHAGLFVGKDRMPIRQTLKVPDPNSASSAATNKGVDEEVDASVSASASASNAAANDQA